MLRLRQQFLRKTSACTMVNSIGTLGHNMVILPCRLDRRHYSMHGSAQDMNLNGMGAARTERARLWSRGQNEQMAPGFGLEADLHHWLPSVRLMNAEERIAWASQHFPGHLAMTSSFGIHSAVLLHLATSVLPDIPIIWIDTGYLPRETYLYAEALQERLQLNLFVSTSAITPARMEATYGKLWEQNDQTAHGLYGKMRKTEPLKRSLKDLNTHCIVSGLRSQQTAHRASLEPLSTQYDSLKLLPLLDWSKADMEQYMIAYNLPAHPLQAQGYVSVGDWHSSRPLGAADESDRDTRFGGLSQECGLHTDGVDSTTSSHPPSTSKATSFSAATSKATSKGTVVVSPKELTSPMQQTAIGKNKTQLQVPPSVLKALGGQELGIYNLDGHPSHPTVLMVKKRMLDGTDCKRCRQVQAQMARDGFETHQTIVATEGQASSAGMQLSKELGIQTAPFFMVRLPGETNFTAEISYYKVKKMLEGSWGDETTPNICQHTLPPDVSSAASPDPPPVATNLYNQQALASSLGMKKLKNVTESSWKAM